MKTILAALLLAATASLVVACGSDSKVTPQPPALFALIDRLGRPAVNTALTNPYDIAKAPGTTTAEPGDATKDRYNADRTEGTWVDSWKGHVRTHLAILDGLDRNCGNQFAADLATPRYSGLAGILADDRLVVDTSLTTCGQYLAVEAGVANDCGGRKLAYDVVDVTYSATAIGALTGVGDDIANDSTFTDTFPYLGNPN